VDARVQQLLDIYESHDASFEDSATMREFCMMSTSSERPRKCPQPGFGVVRAVGGRRAMYAAIQSILTTSTDPRTVADSLLAATGGSELYVADLDALCGHRPNIRWVKELAATGCHVMIDAGAKHAADVKPLLDAGATVVMGTETLASFDELEAVVKSAGADRVVLSIDLRNGRIVGDETALGEDPLAAAVAGVGRGVKRLILLELARVGTGIGPGAVELCGQVRNALPDVELIAGGGVRSWDDVDKLADAGANAVLVASALHDGTITFPRTSAV
jgi:phosphoribosylformimino-5-aminoimidazole carboxamide ribotide isomerase